MYSVQFKIIVIYSTCRDKYKLGAQGGLYYDKGVCHCVSFVMTAAERSERKKVWAVEHRKDFLTRNVILVFLSIQSSNTTEKGMQILVY